LPSPRIAAANRFDPANAFETEFVEGKRFESTRRHGKHLFVGLDGAGWLTVHFGMTGSFVYFKENAQGPAHDRIVFELDNGYKLAYVNPRLFGRVGLTGNIEAFLRARELGPDACTIPVADFVQRVGSKRSAVKSALMDQSLIAGIGNIYSDEILFQAGIHPKRSTGDLSEREVREIHKALRKVLGKAIEKHADPRKLPRSYLLPHREEGARCPGCSGVVEKVKVSGRSGYCCPTCQR
jgi:formamidopyrimidine-DNA glycosylase